MTQPEDLEEDLFADLYDADDTTSQRPAPPAAAPSFPEPEQPLQSEASVPSAPPPQQQNVDSNQTFQPDTQPEQQQQQPMNGGFQHNGYNESTPTVQDSTHSTSNVDSGSHGTGIKEDGKYSRHKIFYTCILYWPDLASALHTCIFDEAPESAMFIGGLNWETTDQSLKDYFSQFGEVQECTVMRDGATGRSRGFGFLTFKDPKTVNTVMVKEHYLDGKIIDPKRAIPRDEQERTSKIFVGGVSQEATEQDFKQFFMQFGRVVDATLMIDKDSGRPRGFGFVTFDSEAAVEATLSGPLEILGKPIEVKKAQPRGNMRDDDDRGRGPRRGMQDRFGRDNDRSAGPDGSQQQQNTQNQGGLTSGMSPQMMAQYWQRMQQYFALMQQQMAAAAAQGQSTAGMGMAGMNPAMLQQMQQMSAMGGGAPQGGMNQGTQGPGPQGMQGMMNPAMMQQMQQMQQMQNQGPGAGPGGPGFGGGGMGGQMNNAMGPGPGGPGMGGNMGGGNVPGGPPGPMGGAGGGNMGMGGGPGGNFSGPRGGPGYNAQEQIAFEQQKYEQQQARRAIESSRGFTPYQQGGPTSWEGMYDDVPQPNIPTGPQGGAGMGRAGSVGGGIGRGMSPSHSMTPQHGGARPSPAGSNKSLTPQPQSAPPANAPTGPRNAGKPGANYRGGGRGAHRGFHPYART
ncbi:hypothetical protein AJ79_00102 [Helicocarpus griseus UAMH5409]|uniref:RRM domain-containing protein n=1 Tax=Helicocarpus griseus UAMH5409 TaxID=1447875 RepID=A0A2B7YDU1_9EURO|nr:hypothetical protein AJ79_00102 [Helicocarpus griseus UAMH5409]